MIIAVEPLKYRGNKVFDIADKDGKITRYNKAVFEGSNLEDVEISVKEPLTAEAGKMYKLACELKWGKYPKLQVLAVKEFKEEKEVK
jgi:hypothetical protein